MKVTNVLYYSSDLSGAVDFYVKVGFVQTHLDDNWAEVKLGDFGITLTDNSDTKGTIFEKDGLSPDKGLGQYLYIEVDDVDAKYAELKEKGIISTTEPKNWPWGNREFIAKDPDGYKLCFWKVSKK